MMASKGPQLADRVQAVVPHVEFYARCIPCIDGHAWFSGHLRNEAAAKKALKNHNLKCHPQGWWVA